MVNGVEKIRKEIGVIGRRFRHMGDGLAEASSNSEMSADQYELEIKGYAGILETTLGELKKNIENYGKLKV